MNVPPLIVKVRGAPVALKLSVVDEDKVTRQTTVEGWEGADDLVWKRRERVTHDRDVVLSVDDDHGPHRFVVTSPSIRAVYFSNSSVSIANWMIFSWPWKGYLRQTSTCVPENSITL